MAIGDKYCIYILLLNGDPIYVGCSKDVKKRLYKHRINKKFDTYMILRRFENKKQALDYEKGIIDFMTIFHTEKSLNNTNPLIEFSNIKKVK